MLINCLMIQTKTDYITESEEDRAEDDAYDLKRKRRKVTNTNSVIVKEHALQVTRKVVKGETRAVCCNRKKCKNLGLEYITGKGKKVNAKKFKELQECRLKCRERIDTLKKAKIFREFWAIGAFNKRVAYVAGLITCQEKKYLKKEDGKKHKNRMLTHKYFFNLDGGNTEICKNCFLTTFDITNRFVTSVIRNKLSATSGVVHDDTRGKSEPYNKTPSSDLELVKSHINLIPSYESHYTRKNSARKHLQSYYTLKRMYNKYKIWLPADKKLVSQKIYQTQFE
ncbi:hypothetical protein ILUMI_15477, partial [Ignelater luminosus]